MRAACILLLLVSSAVADPPKPAPLSELGFGVLVVDQEAFLEAYDEVIQRKPPRKGVHVLGIRPHSPAAEASMEFWDIIVAIDGKNLLTLDDYRTAKAALKDGQKTVLTVCESQKNSDGRIVWRGSKKITLTPTKRGAAAVAAMKQTTDDVQGATFWKHLDHPKDFRSKTGMAAYFQVTDGKAHNLRLSISYRGEDWIFLQKVLVRAGDQLSSFNIGFFDPEHDVILGGGVSEYLDIPLKKDALETILTAACSSRVPSVRFQGKSGTRDLDAGIRDVLVLEQVLDAYRAMGGQLSLD